MAKRTSTPQSPAKRTTTSYAVLGLLSVRTWTTYELAKQVQRSLHWFWPRAERKLYDEPKRLVEQGLATAVREQHGQRPRTVYQITPPGRAALRGWLSEPPAPRSIEFEGMVKVFFADAGSLVQLNGTIESIESEAMGRLAALADLAATDPLPFPQRAHLSAIGLRLHYEQEDAVRRWAQWAKRQVAQWETTADPGTWDCADVFASIAKPAP
ncbi:MAG: PadR family transcriptional regulator [Dermatophilaceae bacterium]